MEMHPAVMANVLELQAIKLTLFGIAARAGARPTWVADVYRRLEIELIHEVEQKEEDNDNTKSGEGGL